MSTPHEQAPAPAALPHLAEIFQALRRGRHIDIDDSRLYAALKASPEQYIGLFAELGFDLRQHPRDFFYFHSAENFTETSARMALFVFLLVEHLADHGQPIEETLMSQRFRVDELPHLSSDRSRRLLAEAGVAAPADLDGVLSAMERHGFVRREDSGAFVFRTPAYRFLDVCLELAAGPATAAAASGEPPAGAETGDQATVPAPDPPGNTTPSAAAPGNAPSQESP